MHAPRLTRRRMMTTSAASAACLAGLPSAGLFAQEETRAGFQISACDWSLGKTGQVEALEVAKEVGLDGVQVSFGPPGANQDLRDADVRRRYLDEARRLGLEINSLAMGCLNGVPYSSSADAERWVAECVEVMPKMNVKVVLLAFFGNGDVKDKPDLQDEVIRRLKRVAPVAERNGVILGLETWLNAAEHLHILDAVGSDAVQVYYDVANMTTKGYDIFSDIRRVGAERICEVHCKENGFLLGTGRVDFQKVHATLADVGWNGWLVVEGATVGGKTITECYQHNQKFLRRTFGA